VIGFVLKRLGWMAITLWVIFTISFALMRSVPGGPFSGERQLDPEIEKNAKARYGLDKPLYVQYFRELWNDLHFDLGPSLRLVDFSVNEVIEQGFPISASLGIFALTFALALGLTAGIVSALRRQTTLDFSLMTVATIGIALPNFVVAGIAIMLFVFVINIFPAAGWGTLSHLVLPGLCLGSPYAAYIARLTRTGMLDVLGQDYIRTAQAKGLWPTQVVLKHALRGALLPVVSFLGPAIAGLLTGSLVIEQIFAIPGLGMHFINAATQRDYTLAMGIVLLYTTLVYSMNLLVDLSYTLLDPRVKLE
jgi:ABC-type dipeptide/oligopeptide/nickel transport system permease component